MLDDKADIFVSSLLITYCSFSNLINNSHDLLHIYSKKSFLHLEGLSDGKVLSLTKIKYGSTVHFFINHYEIFKINSSLSLGIIVMKTSAKFSLTSLDTLKFDCVIKAIQMFNFLPLINNSVTIGFDILLLIISAIISSKTIVLRFLLYFFVFFIVFFNCILQYFYKDLAYHLGIQ